MHELDNAMTGKPPKGHRTGSAEKRGGYMSSSKSVSELKPPPKGPAPGGAKPKATTKNS